MTTNAVDMKQLIVACDSRWSIDLDADHVLALDDGEFRKLAHNHAGCMVVAGDSVLIDGWMRWFHAPSWDFLNPPPLNRTNEAGQLGCIVFHLVLVNGTILVPPVHPNFEPPIVFEDKARFAGTGARYAHECFVTNGCVKQSVKTAAKSDVYTGGATMHMELKKGLPAPSTFSSSAKDLRDEIVKRGTVMDRKTMQPLGSYGDFAARQSAKGKGAAANVSEFVISAPTGVPAFVWSQEQKSELMKAFAEMAVLEEDLKAR